MNSAYITDEVAVGYFQVSASDEEPDLITGWNGQPIGIAEIVAAWRTPYSHISTTMYQIEATINGVVYTGRGAGHNMVWRGKRKAQQPRRH